MIRLIYLNYLNENLKMARMIDGFLPYKPTNYTNCYFLVDIYIKPTSILQRYSIIVTNLHHSPQTNSPNAHISSNSPRLSNFHLTLSLTGS